MNRTRFLGAAVAALLIVIVTFILAPAVWAASQTKLLHKFTGGKDGSNPYSTPIFDSAGNLYGTTSGGGIYHNGTVFRLTPKADGSWTESVLYAFTGANDGGGARGSLTFDQAGNLYGTTAWGGNLQCINSGIGCGTLFKLTPNADGSWTENVLYTFCSVTNCADGAGPNGVIFDQSGNLYGTTAAGGYQNCIYRNGCGVVFELTPNADGSWSENVLYSFCSLTNCSDGFFPYAGVIFDANGSLYGTTGWGGSEFQNGSVFKLTPNLDGSWTESVLYAFPGSPFKGYLPLSSLAFDTAGSLYGTTYEGGDIHHCFDENYTGCGLVFKLTPKPDGSWTRSTIHVFHHGGKPFAGVIFDQSGNLYGTTSGGNYFTDGVVYKLTPKADGSWMYDVLHRFAGKPAQEPWGGVALDKAGNLYGTTGKCARNSGCQGVVFEITP